MCFSENTEKKFIDTLSKLLVGKTVTKVEITKNVEHFDALVITTSEVNQVFIEKNLYQEWIVD